MPISLLYKLICNSFDSTNWAKIRKVAEPQFLIAQPQNLIVSMVKSRQTLYESIEIREQLGTETVSKASTYRQHALFTPTATNSGKEIGKEETGDRNGEREKVGIRRGIGGDGRQVETVGKKRGGKE